MKVTFNELVVGDWFIFDNCRWTKIIPQNNFNASLIKQLDFEKRERLKFFNGDELVIKVL